MAPRAIVIGAGGLCRLPKSPWEVTRWLPKSPSQIARWLLVAGLVATLSACGGGGSNSTSASNASFADLVGAGEQLLARGNPAAAAQVFEQAIAKRPQSPVGYYDLGVAHNGEGARRRSLADYGAALRRDPRYVPALYNLGVLFIGHPGIAAHFFRRVIQLKPDSPTAWLHLGLLTYENPKLRARALQELKRAVVLQPSLSAQIPAQARKQLGSVHLARAGAKSTTG